MLHQGFNKMILSELIKYRISRPIRHTFFSEKCDLNLTRILCTKGKYYFQTSKFPVPASSENNHEDDFSDSDDDFMPFYDE